MSVFRITVDSPYDEGEPHYRGVLRTPLAGALANEMGERPTAQQVADHFAAEYCDSGSVVVEGGGERGRVFRRNLPD